MMNEVDAGRSVLLRLGTGVLMLAVVLTGCGHLNQRLAARRALESQVKLEAESGVYTELGRWFETRRNDGTLPGFQKGERGTVQLIITNLAPAIVYPYEVNCTVEKQGEPRATYEYKLIKDNAGAPWRLESATKVDKLTGSKTNLLQQSSGELPNKSEGSALDY
jgi:hypothetical protein